MNSFGRAIAIFLAIVMICIFPLRGLAINQAEIMHNHVEHTTKEFADEIMLKGYLTAEMYDSYLDKLAETNQLYDIELIHTRQKQSFNLGEDNRKNLISLSSLKEEKAFTLLGNVKTQQPLRLSKYENSINEEESDENEIFSLAAHTHTDACYAGHRHTAECYITADSDINYARGLDGVTITLLSDTTSGWITSTKRVDVKCSTCSQVIASAYVRKTSKPFAFGDAQLVRYYHGTEYGSTGQKIKIFSVKERLESNTYIPGYIDRGSNYSTDHNYRYCAPTDNPEYTNFVNILNTIRSNPTASQTELLGLLNQIGFNSDMACWNCAARQNKPVVTYHAGDQILVCRETQDETPICNQVVTSITATNPNQTVYKGGSIITTATATYLDGHTGTVNCSSNFNPNLVGNQTVTLTYAGRVGNAKTTGTRTCTVNVTVMESKIPSSLVVVPSSNTVNNGQEPTYTVTVYYADGSNKILSSGFTKSGFTPGAGIKTVTFSYTENGKTVTTSIIINVKRNQKTCAYGHTYELDDYDTDKGCPICKTILSSIQVSPNVIVVSKGESLKINVTGIYLDGHSETILSGWQSNFDSNRVGEQLVTIEYGGKTADIKVTVTEEKTCPICGTKYPLINGEDPGCPICSKKVVSIKATPETQHIIVGGDIDLEVTATYLDGHTGVVLDWTSSFNPFMTGQQSVTVYYETAITTVNVFVESPSEVTCPICGTTYNPILYPNGCPVCSNIIVAIEAGLRSGGTKVQYGSELNLYVVVIYRDNHRETVYNDWDAKGYEPNRLGHQTIEVTYKEFETTLDIEVVNTLEKKVCPYGHVYYLNEDGSDPGCPYCNTDTSDESSIDYTECIYTPEILNILYTNGIYHLEFGDYITINVSPKATSIYDKIKHLPFNNDVAEVKKYSYGGMVDYGERI